jgi:hypothetical protein
MSCCEVIDGRLRRITTIEAVKKLLDVLEAVEWAPAPHIDEHGGYTGDDDAVLQAIVGGCGA